MPMRRAVAATRQAISPRFAIRILSNMRPASLRPARLALLEEGRDALGGVLGGARARDPLGGLVRERVVDAPAAHRADELLGGVDRLRAGVEEMAQHRLH